MTNAVPVSNWKLWIVTIKLIVYEYNKAIKADTFDKIRDRRLDGRCVADESRFKRY